MLGSFNAFGFLHKSTENLAQPQPENVGNQGATLGANLFQKGSRSRSTSREILDRAMEDLPKTGTPGFLDPAKSSDKAMKEPAGSSELMPKRGETVNAVRSHKQKMQEPCPNLLGRIVGAGAVLQGSRGRPRTRGEETQFVGASLTPDALQIIQDGGMSGGEMSTQLMKK